jgi:hypothetical protein
VVQHTNDNPALKPLRRYAQMRERSSDAEGFEVEFLVQYHQGKLREFTYVRRKDQVDIAYGDYEVREGLDERRRTRKKWNGKWQVKWRNRWSRRDQ